MSTEAVAQQEPETIGAADVADLVQPLPEVNAAAIDAAREQEAQAQADEAQAQAPAPAAAPAAPPLAASPAAAPAAATQPKQRTRVAVTDEKGRPFNPLLHECTRDGQPIMRSAPNDRWVRARRQPLKEWKRESVIGEEQPAAPEQPQAAPEPVIDAAKQLAAAQTMAGLQIMAMRMALGDKLASSDVERTELVNGWHDVFRHYGICGTFHPVVGLALVSGGIVAAGLRHEDTRSRLLRLWHWTQHQALSVWQMLRGGRRSGPKPSPAKPERESAERAAA